MIRGNFIQHSYKTIIEETYPNNALKLFIGMLQKIRKEENEILD